MDKQTLFEKSSEESKRIYGDEIIELTKALKSARNKLIPLIQRFDTLFYDYENLIERLFYIIKEAEFLNGLNMSKYLKQPYD